MQSLVDFARNDGALLPASDLGSGDIVSVGLQAPSGQAPLTGVVFRINETRVTVSFEEYPEEIEEPTTLVRLGNEVTFRRYREALEGLGKSEDSCRLRNILFGHTMPTFNDRPPPYTPLDAALNSSQLDAVQFALAANDVALIHGPPGTGKTTAVIEIIRQTVARGQRVLACAASNVAVDNMVERLARHKLAIVRVGHPARLLPEVVRYSLDALVRNHDNQAVVEDVRKDMSSVMTSIRNAANRTERGSLRGELKRLKKELFERETQTSTDILSHAQVILCTSTGAAMRDIRRLGVFDLVVIDECAQSIETACWIPLLVAKKCVLAGDHLQLPPTIKSKEAQHEGLEVTLFDRLVAMYGELVTRMLTIQYRMHEHIMHWPSHELYQGKLIAGDSVRAHRLCDLPGLKRTINTVAPFVFVDSAGCNLVETQGDSDRDGLSKRNPGEAEVVAQHVRRLVAAGLPVTDMAIITPYNAQVDCLRQVLLPIFPSLEIGTVDGFQGREKEAILISLVRSNADRTVGFLSEDRRLNVALTRARRHLWVIGDSATVGSHPFIHRLINFAQTVADYRSAQEYIGSLDNVDEDDEVSDDEPLDLDLASAATAATAAAAAGTPASALARATKARGGKKDSKTTEKLAARPAPAVAMAPRPPATALKELPLLASEAAEEALKIQFIMDVETCAAPLLKWMKFATGASSARPPATAAAPSLLSCQSFVLTGATHVSLDFPSSLTPFQRLMVHEIAERLGLSHESIGEVRIPHFYVPAFWMLMS